MSKNCIKCVKRRRTGGDLLCDECRAEPPLTPEEEAFVESSWQKFKGRIDHSAKLVWREVQSSPLIYEAEPKPHHCYLMVEHGTKWAASLIVGDAHKVGTTLSPKPEKRELAMWRIHSHWEGLNSAFNEPTSFKS